MDKIKGYIGLAARAGKLAYGGEGATDAVRRGRAGIVLLAQDASDNTKKLVLNKCKSYGVTVRLYSDKQCMGAALGKREVSAVAVCDKGLSAAITKIFGGDL